MEHMNFIEGEKVILETSKSSLVVTNIRIRTYFKGKFRSKFDSILLDNISSIGIRYRANSVYLFISIISVVVAVAQVFGMYLSETISEIIALITGVSGIIFLLLYYNSREHVLTVSSKGGGEIKIVLKELEREDAIKIVDIVENGILTLYNDFEENQS